MVNFMPFIGFRANPNYIKRMLILPIDYTKKQLKNIPPYSIARIANPEIGLVNPTVKETY